MITPVESENIRKIALWAAIMAVHSSGGQGVRGTNHKPATVKYPKLAKEATLAREALGWHYTRLPYGVARYVFMISETIWERKRATAGNPPLLNEQKAHLIQKMLRDLTTKYIEKGGGGGAGDAGAASLAHLWSATE